MSLQGGEAERLTDLAGGVSDYAWSPDGRRLVLVSEVGRAPDSEDNPQPIVIDRLQFKEDEKGYLRTERSHLFLLDLETRAVTTLTDGPYDELSPAWSPDSASIAFVSKRGPDPDADDNWDVYRIDARAGATASRITTDPGKDGDPEQRLGGRRAGLERRWHANRLCAAGAARGVVVRADPGGRHDHRRRAG